MPAPMPIIVYCKACAKKIRAPDAAIGKAGKCPRCNAEVPIPSTSEEGPPKGLPAQPDKDDAEDAPEAPPPASTPAPPKPEAPPQPSPKAPAAKAPSQPKPPAPPVKGKPISLRMDRLEEGVKLKATREDLDGIRWDTVPGPPSHWPWVFGLIALALTALGGWLLWYSASGSADTAPAVTPAEERQRLQFKVPPANDGFRDFRLQQAPHPPDRANDPPAAKTEEPSPRAPDTPAAPKSEAPAEAEVKSPTPEPKAPDE